MEYKVVDEYLSTFELKHLKNKINFNLLKAIITYMQPYQHIE